MANGESYGILRHPGGDYIPSLDSRYPTVLRCIPDPPAVLYAVGNVDLLRSLDRAVAIVGARKATPYGARLTRDISGELTKAGCTIVSGMAYGIDAEAHSACLDAGGNTIAVLAGGVDIPYPAANRSLYERILDNDGLILSEAPPGTRARRDMFVKRNRIVTGLAQALVIIEAEMSSGSLTSARFAAEQGKDLFCPPGPVYAPTCQGTHYLLKNGAVLITEADDILSWLGWESHPGLDIRPFPSSSDPILTTLAYGPLHADTLAARTGMDMSELMGKVSLLELEGSITRNTRGEYEAI